MTLPCHRCGNPGVRDLGNQGFCSPHLEELYATFDPAVFAYNGVGYTHGRPYPEYGPLYVELACNACRATWVGIPGEPCGWCRRAHQQMLDDQAELDRSRT